MAKSLLTVSKLEKLDVDYDGTGDVLYISFGPSIAGSDSRVFDNDVVSSHPSWRICRRVSETTRSRGSG